MGFLTIAPSIYIGIKYFDGKVTAQPYEEGLVYDAAKKLIEDNGLQISMLTCAKDGENALLEFSLEGTRLENPVYQVTRPASDKDMFEIVPEERHNGLYASIFTVNAEGYHILKVTGTLEGRPVSIQKSFYIN